MENRTSKSDLSENDPQKKKTETKMVRIGTDGHEYLRQEAFKRNISMKELLDEVLEEYRKNRH
ncbi:MAG: hypothetical protein L0K82_05725 [Pisciglobus halotolerans]|nr:hypothetical protein [Pisciglobus halotolerans]